MLYLIVRLHMSKEQLSFVHPKSTEARQSTYHRFSTSLFHFHYYPNHCISHGILQSTRHVKIFSVLNSQNVFFFSSKHDRNRNRKRRVIPAVPHSVHREKLITWRQAFLGRQCGLGVFHCAHS